MNQNTPGQELTNEEIQLLLLVCAWSVVPVDLRREVEVDEDNWLSQAGEIADKLLEAKIPSQESLQVIWCFLSSRMGDNEYLKMGLTLMGTSTEIGYGRPGPMNRWYSLLRLIPIFDDGETSSTWVQNCLSDHFYDVMKANELDGPDSKNWEYEDREWRFDEFYDTCLAELEERLDIPAWQREIRYILASGPRNSRNESCLDVVNRCYPEWRELDQAIG